MNGQSEHTSPDVIDRERQLWSDFQAKVGQVKDHLSGDVHPDLLDDLVELGKRVETVAMARLLRWLRDTTLAMARQEHPLNPVLDRLDAEIAHLLKALG